MKNVLQSRAMSRNVRYLTTEDVTERFSITSRTLQRWIRHRGFPTARKISRKRYYAEPDVNAWDEAQTGKPIDEPPTALGLQIVSGVIQTYDEFTDAMRARRETLGMSVVESDAKSGMQEGYTSKLENAGARWGRGVGPETLPLWLGGLRVGFVLVDLPRRPVNRSRS